MVNRQSGRHSQVSPLSPAKNIPPARMEYRSNPLSRIQPRLRGTSLRTCAAVLASIVTVSLCSIFHVNAQQNLLTKEEMVYLQQLKQAARNTINLIFPEVIKAINSDPTLTESEKKRVRQMNAHSIIISDSDRSIFSTRAEANRITGERRVVLPLGLLVIGNFFDIPLADWMYVRRTLSAPSQKAGDDKMSDYWKYVADRLVINDWAARQGKVGSSVAGFCLWAKLPCVGLDRTSSDYITMLEVIKSEVFFFVTAHELAHHVLGHTEKWAGSYKQEVEADSAAVRWATYAKRPLIGALPAVVMMGLIDRSTPTDAKRGTHPHPACRVIQILYSGLSVMNSDPNFAHNQKTVSEYLRQLESHRLANRGLCS